MDKKNPLRVFGGGRASRAEVYGLFVAAVVLIGGGVGGAIAFTNPDSPLNVTTPADSSNTETASATANPSATSEPGATQDPANGTPAQGTTSGTSAGNSGSCEYTAAEQNYYNSIRSTKQAAVDEAQSRVESVHGWIASNTAHLEELLAAPYRPIEVFQWHADGTPMSYRVDSNEEIAFERQRIVDNQSELIRAEEALRQAVAARDLIPGC